MPTFWKFLWKTPVVFAALLIGSIAACQVGWSGAEAIINLTHRGILGQFLLNLLFWVGLVLCIGTFLLVRRIAKPFLWVMVPVFLYCAILLGAWDGMVSGFDPIRAQALKHHSANAYALQRMSQRGRFLSCKDAQIDLSEDSKAVCVQALQNGPGNDTLQGLRPACSFHLRKPLMLAGDAEAERW